MTEIAMKVALSGVVCVLPAFIVIAILGAVEVEPPEGVALAVMLWMAACGVAFVGGITAAIMFWVWAL